MDPVNVGTYDTHTHTSVCMSVSEQMSVIVSFGVEKTRVTLLERVRANVSYCQLLSAQVPVLMRQEFRMYCQAPCPNKT